MMGWVAAAFLAAIALALGWMLLRSSTRIHRLERGLTRAGADLERVQRTFQRFAPEHVVEVLSDEKAQFEGEMRDVTVMFADIVGFTPLSERIDPATTVQVLNGYFTAMEGAINAHHGRISRIMGDGLLAMFGALEDNPWHVADGVRAALAMRAAIIEYNRELRARSLPELTIGVGLHRGRVVVGVIGSSDKKEYTAIGEAVNIAARVEALTRQHQADVLITDAVRDSLDDRFEVQPLPPTQLKGVSQPVRTWTVQRVTG
jgi:class 3 adenylate cyclase